MFRGLLFHWAYLSCTHVQICWQLKFCPDACTTLPQVPCQGTISHRQSVLDAAIVSGIPLEALAQPTCGITKATVAALTDIVIFLVHGSWGSEVEESDNSRVVGPRHVTRTHNACIRALRISLETPPPYIDVDLNDIGVNWSLKSWVNANINSVGGAGCGVRAKEGCVHLKIEQMCFKREISN